MTEVEGKDDGLHRVRSSALAYSLYLIAWHKHPWIMVLPLNDSPTPVNQKSCWQLDWTNMNRGRNAGPFDLMLSKLETLDGCVPFMQESWRRSGRVELLMRENLKLRSEGQTKVHRTKARQTRCTSHYNRSIPTEVENYLVILHVVRSRFDDASHVRFGTDWLRLGVVKTQCISGHMVNMVRNAREDLRLVPRVPTRVRSL